MKNKIDTKLNVTEIQRFCMHDGPGIRTTVFLKGCPLRCAWCHNPETQKAESELLYYTTKCIMCGICGNICECGGHNVSDFHTIDREKCITCGGCARECPTGALEICGCEYSIDGIIAEVEKDRAFYGATGGITISGGEPLTQGEAVAELLAACKSAGFNTAIETCGLFPTELLEKVVPNTDLFLWDIKDTDEERHRKNTGVSNKKILENLYRADSLGAKTLLRCIVVNGINTDEEHFRRVGVVAASLRNCIGVELIPYHAYGGTKATFIGLEDNGRREWIPSEEQISSAKDILRSVGVTVI